MPSTVMTPLHRFTLDRWTRVAAATAIPSAPGCFADLAGRYAEAHRFYHNALHIEECLAELDAAKATAGSSTALELAIWFHDAIYDPKRGDNEERSAALAREKLRADPTLADHVSNLILATKNHVASGPEAALFLDIDLSILGKPESRFTEYENQIRQEYSWVPAKVYREKRAEVLRGFLARPRIYATERLFEQYESQARANLSASIERLKQN